MSKSSADGASRPSMHDVARIAEVSPSTVSRFLNGKLRLAPSTETRIRKAIEATGYALKVDRSRELEGDTIAVVVPQVDMSYFGELAEHTIAAAQRNGMKSILITTSRAVSGASTLLELVRANRIAGVVYAEFRQLRPFIEEVMRAGVPVVAVAEAITGVDVDTVRVDHSSAARQGIAYLASMGHRRIALITGPRWLTSSKASLKGYLEAMRSTHLETPEHLQLFGEVSRDFGYAACSQLLLTPERPTAIYASADEFALGVYSAARDLGVHLPHDLSVVSSDDISYANFLSPPLTSVRHPRAQIADRAVQLLLQRMTSEGSAEPVEVMLPVSLQVRQSVAPATES